MSSKLSGKGSRTRNQRRNGGCQGNRNHKSGGRGGGLLSSNSSDHDSGSSDDQDMVHTNKSGHPKRHEETEPTAVKIANSAKRRKIIHHDAGNNEDNGDQTDTTMTDTGWFGEYY